MNLKKKEGREIVAILEDQSAFFRTSNSTMLGRARRQTRGCSSISNKVNWKTLFARRGLRERAGERFPRVGDSMATREGWLLYRCLASLVEALQLNGIEKTRRGNRRGGPSELAKLIFLIGTIGSNGSTIGERERETEKKRDRDSRSPFVPRHSPRQINPRLCKNSFTTGKLAGKYYNTRKDHVIHRIKGPV